MRSGAGRVTAVILAAGRSSRMRGAVKALLPLRAPWGEPEGEVAIARQVRLLRAAGVGRIVVVLGHHGDVIGAQVGRWASLAVNAAPDRGMFSSVCVGLRVALEITAAPSGVLVWPVDVPLVASETLSALLEGEPGLDDPEGVWVSMLTLSGSPELTGHPVLMSRAAARSALGCGADRLDEALEQVGGVVRRAAVRDRMILVDLDTPEGARGFVLEGVGEAKKLY